MSAGSRILSGIGAVLAESAVAVWEDGPGLWTLRFYEASARARADSGSGWLVIESPIERSAAARSQMPDWWQWLRRNARLAGIAKCVRPLDATEPALRADLPIDEGTVTFAGAREACAALSQASTLVNGRIDLDVPAPVGSPLTLPVSGKESPASIRPGRAEIGSAPVLATDLAALCSEAGWSYTERQGQRLAVDLGVDRVPAHAMLQSSPDGSFHARVELCRAAALTAASRDALGLFLITASAILRLARAYAVEEEGAIAAGFEVRYGAPPTAGELGHALSALSVACALFGKEAVALTDDRAARAYLAVRGGALPVARAAGDMAHDKGDTAIHDHDRSPAPAR